MINKSQQAKTKAVAIPDTKAIALTDTHGEALHFEEDMTLLSIDCKRIFRLAVNIDADMSQDMPSIEGEAAAAVEGLGEAIVDLDNAHDGIADVDAALAEWKETLVGQAS